MRNIKYNGQGTTVCPWGMTSFAGGAKIVGSLGCMNCVNHAGQSYTADGGVVCCLRGETGKTERPKKAERPKRSDGSNGRTKTKRVTKKVTKKVSNKVSKNNNKKEEKK
jgi:hypothetical protein